MLCNIYNLLWACPLVVLHNIGVRVLEFGTKWLISATLGDFVQ